MCSVKGCRSRAGSGINLFMFPLNNENRLDKWITVVGKPNWKPKKTSKICNLHFNENDIIQGMGYRRTYLRQNAVPKDCSSITVENEQTGTAILKSKEICGAQDIGKFVSFSKTPISSKIILHDHNYVKDKNCIIENDESNILTRESYQLPKATFHPDKKHIFIQISPKEYITVPISHNSTNSNFKEEITDMADTIETINKLSRNLKKLKQENKILKRKLKKYEENVTSIKEIFHQFQQKKLTDSDSLCLLQKYFEDLTLKILRNGSKNRSRKVQD